VLKLSLQCSHYPVTWSSSYHNRKRESSQYSRATDSNSASTTESDSTSVCRPTQHMTPGGFHCPSVKPNKWSGQKSCRLAGQSHSLAWLCDLCDSITTSSDDLQLRSSYHDNTSFRSSQFCLNNQYFCSHYRLDGFHPPGPNAHLKTKKQLKSH